MGSLLGCGSLTSDLFGWTGRALGGVLCSFGMKGKIRPDDCCKKEPRVSGVLLEVSGSKRPAEVSDLAVARPAGHPDRVSEPAVESAGRASGSASDRPAADHLGPAADFVGPACRYAAGLDYSFSLLQGRYCPSASESTIALCWGCLTQNNAHRIAR
jgi:hypothetical protein